MDKNQIIKNKQIRRKFLKTVGLISLGITLPRIVSGKHSNKHTPERKSVIEIREGKSQTTLITTFSVEAHNTENLINLFIKGVTEIFEKQPGYISSSIHKSVDNKKLVLYGQWDNPDSIQKFREKPEVLSYFEKVKAWATFESVVCIEIPYVHHK